MDKRNFDSLFQKETGKAKSPLLSGFDTYSYSLLKRFFFLSPAVCLYFAFPVLCLNFLYNFPYFAYIYFWHKQFYPVFPFCTPPHLINIRLTVLSLLYEVVHTIQNHCYRLRLPIISNKLFTYPSETGIFNGNIPTFFMQAFPLLNGYLLIPTVTVRRYVNSNVWGTVTHTKLPQTILRYSFLRPLP